jgi:DNA-binding response OmpR family regulator
MSQKVLVVDDDRMILEMLGAMLKHGGYEPVLADSARQALELFEIDPPPVAFLDIVMPEMDGMELATVLKAEHPDTRLIALSGHAAESLDHDWRDVGFADFLKKPVDMRQLLAAAECD